MLSRTKHLLCLTMVAGLSTATSPLLGSAAEPHQASTRVPALYATKAEAEAAAKQHFNCTGAHAMGKQWMPCAAHGHSQHSH